MTAISKQTSHMGKYALIVGFLLIAAVGCTGMMNSNTNSDSSSVKNGSFVDSPVNGLHYETETQTGTTDENGTFTYKEGETITFYIGDTKLGSAKAESSMTPVHLVDGAKDETDPTVTNMGMLLQSLDEDGNPDNGITITPEAADLVSQTDIDLNVDPSDFHNQDSLKKMMDAMNEKEMFTDGDHMMKTPEEAQDHMKEYMTPYLDNNTSGQDMMGSGMGMDSMMKKKADNTSASIQGKHDFKQNRQFAANDDDTGGDDGSGHGNHGHGGMNLGGSHGGC